ncbi:unnamed protein product [Scytosiphon promiscuus]
MAYVGRRVEVFWPPDGDSLEGNWYSGLLDGFEDGANGGKVYHVTYDDGDEENLQEGEIDARRNVRLMPYCASKLHPQIMGEGSRASETSVTVQEEGADLCGVLEVGRKAAAGGVNREQHGGADTRIREAPTGGDMAEISYREIERPTSPGEGSPSSGSDLSGDGNAHRYRGYRLSSTEGPLSGANSESGVDDGTSSGKRDGGRRPIEIRTELPQPEAIRSAHNGKRSDPSAHGSKASAEERGNDIGVRGSYRENAGPGDEDGDEDEEYDDQEEADEEEESFIEDYFLLSGNSSEWTPLRGADLVAASPTASRQRLQSREWFQGFSAGNGEKPRGHSESAAPAATTTSTTEACISALRNAVAAAAATRFPEGAGAFGPSGRLRSSTFRHDPSGTRKGRTSGDHLIADDVDEGLMALGAFVNETALLEGAVEGLEDGEGRELAATGGVFVKVSFMDGEGRRGGATSTTNDAMFRCKTLVHTTGSLPVTGGGDGGIIAGWQNGKFQFETFHGGRLDELSSVAVLFSAHRRRNDTGRGGGFARGSRRDGFLGQVVLPLHGLVHNLRPVVEPLKACSVAGVDTSEGDGKCGRTAAVPGLVDEVGSNNIDGGKGCWRSLRGEISGVFPAADRRGKISTDGGSGLHLRLRLSVSLGVKAEGYLERVEVTPPQPFGRAAAVIPAAAAAPYATVGCGRALENGAPRQRRYPSASESKGRKQGGAGRRDGEGRTRRNRNKGAAGTPAIPRSNYFTPRTGSRRKSDGGGRGREKGAGTKWKHKPLTPAATSEHHGAALARQRLKAQEKIARENERLERRLKVIREAPPAPFTPHSYLRAGKISTPGGRHGLGGGGCKDTAAVKTFSNDNSNDCSGDDVVKNGAGGRRESTAWRELYHEREALALAVEAAAAEAASARDQVEALRTKTLWTEANARSASLAVASLEKLLYPRGPDGPPRRMATKEGAVPAQGSAVAPRLGRAIVPAYPNLDGPIDEGLAAELRRQEDLYEALVETRGKAVTAAEAARLAQEADLNELDDLRTRQEQAENRQARHEWRWQHGSSATAVAAERNNHREDHSWQRSWWGNLWCRQCR